ncbi:ABC transporter substrate-binding protein (plasmid) [Pseudomonas silvicola]|nr:ABC transporter substrate-binding protein [Pseudomonas silvicola]
MTSCLRPARASGDCAQHYRKALLNVVYFGYATPTETPVGPNLKAFHNKPSPYQYDLAAANALLDEAGYKKGDDGVRLRVTLDYSTFDDTFRRNAEFVRSALARVGGDIAFAGSVDLRHTRIYSTRFFLLHRSVCQPIRSHRRRAAPVLVKELPSGCAIYQYLSLPESSG